MICNVMQAREGALHRKFKQRAIWTAQTLCICTQPHVITLLTHGEQSQKCTHDVFLSVVGLNSYAKIKYVCWSLTVKWCWLSGDVTARTRLQSKSRGPVLTARCKPSSKFSTVIEQKLQISLSWGSIVVLAMAQVVTENVGLAWGFWSVLSISNNFWE
jgi:hypothetical protein